MAGLVSATLFGVPSWVQAAANQFNFSSATYPVAENTPGFIQIPVIFGGGATGAVQVTVATVAGGTAVAGTHYIAQTNILNFSGTADETNFFTVLLFDNAAVDGNRTINVALSAPSAGTALGVPSTAQVIVTDDESPVNPPPANDNFTNATVIAGLSGFVTNSSTFATKETGEPSHAGNAGGASVWFRWTAPFSGQATFTTVGSPFNTTLAIYTGTSVGALTPVASDDNSGPGVTSSLTFTAVAGQEYRIAIDGFGGATGNYRLNWGSAGFAGSFGFSTADFFTSDRESVSPFDISAARESFNGTRITIVRNGGFTGKVRVFYRVTDGTAIRGADYLVPGATVDPGPGGGVTNSIVFYDWQASASFFINPILNANSTPQLTVGLQIYQVQLEPDESTAILPPTINPVTGNSQSRIMDTQVGVNFERSRFRVNEYEGTLTIRVLRPSTGVADNNTTRYNINSTPPQNSPNRSDWPLDPGSDYATPGATNDFVAVSGIFTWGTATFFEIDIPINDDDLVEFNEDFVVRLFNQPGDNGAPLGANISAYVTIRFDDRAAAEAPAGSVDPNWNRDFFIGSNPPNNATPGANGPVQAVVVQTNNQTIIGGDFTSVNSQSRNRITRLNADGTLDATFAVGSGANNTVSALALQTNGAVLLGGNFTSINGTPRGRMARLVSTGGLDPSFNPGTGANASVRALDVYTNAGPNIDKVIVAGDFTQFNGASVGRIVRLNPNGSIDNTFNSGTGANGPINSVLVLVSGKVVIGGDFTAVNGVPRNRIARLNVDGSVDELFDPGAGADGPVYAISLDPSGNFFTSGRTASGGPEEDRFTIDTGSTSGTIQINYDFYFQPDSIRVYYDGAIIYDSGVTGGSQVVNIPYGPGNSTTVEIVVNEGGGEFGTVWDYSVTVFPAGGVQRYLIGGSFTSVDFQVRNRLARLNPGGSLDASFDPGLGADDTVFTLARGPGGTSYLGGLFTAYNGTRRVGLARVAADGSLDTTFMDAAYNHFAGVPNPNSQFSQPKNFVRSLRTMPNGGVMIGGSFRQVGGGGFNTSAFGTASPWGPNLLTPLTISRDDLRNRYNVARIIGGQTPGPGNISFSQPAYAIDEGAGFIFITKTRTNGSLGAASVNFATGDRPAGPGAASSVSDYDPLVQQTIWNTTHGPNSNTRMFSDAFSGPNNGTTSGLDDVYIVINEDTLVEGDELINLTIDVPQSLLVLGGEPIPAGVAFGIRRATLTILENDPEPAFVRFTTNSFIVNENAGTAILTVERLGGSSGTITLDYVVTDGSATNGQDFVATSGPLTFAAGETQKTFGVTIINDAVAELDESIALALTNLTGATFVSGGNVATLTIYDNDFATGQLRFSETNYNTTEASGSIALTVQRTGGNVGAISAQVLTAPGSAVAGIDFTMVTNTLTWANGDTTPRQVVVPLLTDGAVDGSRQFSVQITNAQVIANANPVPVAGANPTTVTIGDVDAFGTLQFAAANFSVAENGGKAIITVTRQNGVSETVQVNFATADGTAIGGLHYASTNGTLTLGPGVTSANFEVPVINDFAQNPGPNFNRTVILSLNTFSNGSPGVPISALLTIVDDERVNEPAGGVDTQFNAAAGANGFIYALARQPDGQLLIGGDFTAFNNQSRRRLARLDAAGNLDAVFNPPGGASDSVRALALQSDGRILVGGFFTNVAGVSRNRISRLNADGTSDTSFEPGGGADGPVLAIGVHADAVNVGKVVIAGSFAAVDSISRPFVARLNTNGTVDTSFSTGVGPDAQVNSVAIQSNGRVLIGGDFTTVNTVSSRGLARLNANGSLDAAFTANLGAGFAGSVRTVLLQSDGRILVGGLFTNFNGTAVAGLVRLNADGSPDAGFAPNFSAMAGANNSVLGIALQPDGKIIVVGDFTTFSGVTRRRVTRLNGDGTADPTINFGLGADNFIAATLVQINDGRIVIGGGFTEFDGLPRNYLARIYGGVVDGAGRLEFSAPTYSVTEDKTNLLVSVRRLGGTTGAVTADYIVTNSPAANAATGGLVPTLGVDYLFSAGAVAFPQAEVLTTISVPLNDDTLVEGNEVVDLFLSNPTGSAVIGNQPVAELTIVDDDSFVAFSNPTYSINEAVVSGVAQVTVVRTGGTNGSFAVAVVTSNLTATAGLDYVAVTNVLSFAPGELSKVVNVPIIDDAIAEGDETFSVRLANAIGAVSVASPSVATVTIVENDFYPGQLAFAQSTGFFVDENSTNAIITVIRTNGTSGAVTVNFTTANGTATAGLDYVATNGTLAFADGEASKSFLVRVLSDTIIESNETVFVTLSLPTGGATLTGPNPVTLTILNNNEFIFGSFRLATNAVTVTEGVGSLNLSVIRTGGTAGTNSVDVTTTDGTANAGQDYTAVATTLVFNPGETSKPFSVPILTDDLVESNETFTVGLSNPVGGASVGPPIFATVTIVSTNARPGDFVFLTPQFDAIENSGAAAITVLRTNGTTGNVSVDVRVTDGTAIAGVDYIGTNNSVLTLSWTNGDTTPKSFTINLIDDALVEAPETVLLTLQNPQGTSGTPAISEPNAALLIQDNEVPAGSVDIEFTASVDGVVYGLAHRPATVRTAVGGEFNVVDGQGRTNVARLNPNGTVDGFDPGIFLRNGTTNTTVRAVAVYTNGPQTGKIVAVGLFDTVGGQNRTNVVRFNVDGTVDGSFDPGLGPDGIVHAVAVRDDGTVYIGGAFTSVAGTSRPFIAKLLSSGAVDASFNPGAGPGDVVRALAIQSDGKVVAGGDFLSVGATPAARVARFETTGALDATFAANIGAGADASVLAVAVQQDGKVLIGGSFSNFNGVAVGRVARLQDSGVPDTAAFAGTGSGFNDTVLALYATPNGKILVGGAFTMFNGQDAGRLARLNSDGSRDVTINFGTGADDFVAAIVQQADEKIVIGGAFSQFNGSPAQRLARLNGGENLGSGVIEFQGPAFTVNESVSNAVITVVRFGGASNTVTATFTTLTGTATVGVDYQATNGVLTFLPGETVKSFPVRIIDDVIVESDETVPVRLTSVTGGASLGALTNATLTIIENDGVVGFSSPAFSVGEQSGTATITVSRTGGTASTVTVGYQSTAGTATVDADYSEVSGTVTLNPGEASTTFTVPILQDAAIEGNETVLLALTSVAGPANAGLTNAVLTIVDDDSGAGAFGFDSASYEVVEGTPSLLVTVLRTNGSSGAVSVRVTSVDGTAVGGSDFTTFSNTLAFADGEVMKTFNLAILDDPTTEDIETFTLNLGSPIGGATVGIPGTAVVSILDNDSTVDFVTNTFAGFEDVGFIIIDLVRRGSTSATTTVELTSISGTATEGIDYANASGLVVFDPGVTQQSFAISVVPDLAVEGNEQFTVQLSNPFNAVVGANSPAVVTILDDDSVINLETATFTVNENATNGFINIVRSGNVAGTASVVVEVLTGTATEGVDFIGVTNTVNFASGESNAIVPVTVLDDTAVEGNENAVVRLSNAGGSSTLGTLTNGVLTILDDDFFGTLSFASVTYSSSEGATNVLIEVVRTGGSGGTVSVNVTASSGTATSGVDFAATNGAVNFPDGVTNAFFTVNLIDDGLVEGDETIQLTLGNVAGGASIGAPSAATLTVVDDDFNGSLQFSTNLFTAVESDGFAVITVERVGGIAGAIGASFAVANGTAQLGTDYGSPTNSTLSWTNGDVAPKTILIPLVNDTIGETNETVIITLNSPTGGASLGTPAQTTLSIADDDSSAAFASAAFTVNETAGSAIITVLRLGTATNAMSVSYASFAGTAIAGTDYTNVAGTVSWAIGDLSPKTFTIPVVNDALVEGNETISLVLSNVVGGGNLAAPFEATLTIVDDDVSPYFVPAGAVLISESGPVNGIIDSTEVVTVRLAVRNVSGTNTSSLVGTLLSGSGVGAPSAAQNYGVVIADGPSVAREFSFTALATNGGVVTAVLQLQDGAGNLGAVPFVFQIGSKVSKFANTGAITINDNAPASPYPSGITVAGLSGTVGKVTVVVSNLTHTFPGDIDMVLVAPTGQRVMLMSDAGSSANTPNAVTNVTLTFDDAAVGSLTTNKLTNGTYKPTNLTIGGADFFAPPGPGTGPFGSALSDFVGIDPNGTWQLFVFDDNPIDAGTVVSGWCLNFIEAAQVNPAGDLAVNAATTGGALAGAPLTYSVTVTNLGGNVAANVELTNVLTGVATYGGITNPHGSFYLTGSQIVFQLGSIPVAGAKTVTFAAITTVGGSITNRAVVTSTLNDSPLGNNTNVSILAVTESADVALIVADRPDPVVISNALTYTIVVSNLGPSTATGVAVTNALPVGVQFISATTTQGSVINSSGNVIATIGTLSSGASVTVTVVAQPTVLATVTANIAGRSPVTDPNLTNNSAAPKTIVIAQPALLQTVTNATLTLSWPEEASNFVLDCTTNLNPPIIWTPVTNLPTIGGGLRTVILTIDPAAPTKFFRLRQQP